MSVFQFSRVHQVSCFHSGTLQIPFSLKGFSTSVVGETRALGHPLKSLLGQSSTFRGLYFFYSWVCCCFGFGSSLLLEKWWLLIHRIEIFTARYHFLLILKQTIANCIECLLYAGTMLRNIYIFFFPRNLIPIVNSVISGL